MERAERGEPRAVELPPEIADLLRRRVSAWNDPVRLAPLYADQALLSQYGDSSLLIQDTTVSGRKAVSEHVAKTFARAYASAPVAFAQTGGSGQLAAMYVRGEGTERSNLGLAQLSLVKDPSGSWVIAGETSRRAPPPRRDRSSLASPRGRGRRAGST